MSDLAEINKLRAQNAALRSKLDAAEGKVDRAREHVETTLQCVGQSPTFYRHRNKKLEAILSGTAPSAEAGQIPADVKDCLGFYAAESSWEHRPAPDPSEPEGEVPTEWDLGSYAREVYARYFPVGELA